MIKIINKENTGVSETEVRFKTRRKPSKGVKLENFKENKVDKLMEENHNIRLINEIEDVLNFNISFKYRETIIRNLIDNWREE